MKPKTSRAFRPILLALVAVLAMLPATAPFAYAAAASHGCEFGLGRSLAPAGEMITVDTTRAWSPRALGSPHRLSVLLAPHVQGDPRRVTRQTRSPEPGLVVGLPVSCRDIVLRI